MEPVVVKFRVKVISSLVVWLGNLVEEGRFRGRLRRTWDRIPNDLLSVSRRVKSSNTPCCMREGTQSAAPGEADPSNFRFRISGSPGHYAVASTRGHDSFDVVCRNGLLSDLLPSRNIAWGEGGWGCGGGGHRREAVVGGSCWFPPPRKLQQASFIDSSDL